MYKIYYLIDTECFKKIEILISSNHKWYKTKYNSNIYKLRSWIDPNKVTLIVYPNTIQLLEADRIDWFNLGNGDDIYILEKKLDKADWYPLSYNTNIYELDLNALKIRMDLIWEELMAKILHPDRFKRYLAISYDICDDEYIDIENINV